MHTGKKKTAMKVQGISNATEQQKNYHYVICANVAHPKESDHITNVELIRVRGPRQTKHQFLNEVPNGSNSIYMHKDEIPELIQLLEEFQSKLNIMYNFPEL
ncbi:MAG: hypothetical protein H6553_06610 [Chitinophagales bacterium]|nr:hypothetical protein [Chitinophagales bacterium]